MEMGQGRLDEHAADSLLSGEQPGHAGAELGRADAVLRALKDVPSLPVGSEGPTVARMAAIVRESAPVASQERARVDASSRARHARARGRFFRTRVVAVLAAGMLLVGGGLAFAGVLPAPLQNTTSHFLHRIGVHVPERVAPAILKPPVSVPSTQEPAAPGRHGHETAPSGGGSGGRTHHPGSGVHGGQGGQGQQGGGGSDEGGSGGDDSGSGGNQSGGSGSSGSSGSSGDSGGQNGQGAGDGSNDNQGSNS